MSELQKAWAKGKLGFLPEAFPEVEEYDEYDDSRSLAAWERTDSVADLPEHAPDDDSSSASSASSASSTGTVVPSPSQQLFARPQGIPRGRSLDPIPWTAFFERELFIPDDEGNTFHAYFTSPVGKGPLFVMHHGGGSSGLSFAALASEIRKRLPNAGILSPDARYHGSTVVGGGADAPLDLTLETLTADLVFVIQAVRAQMKWPALPPIVLIGHSLGGAVVTQAANTATAGAAPLGTSLLGYVVLDVVEGSAMDALQSMLRYLSTRPSGFASLQSGIDWHIRSRTIRNAVSARTSVPSLLINMGGGGEDGPAAAAAAAAAAAVGSAAGGARPWRWRTDLEATQPFWESWFVGLSKKFLGGRGGKMLLLAGTDRLDTELTIGQMQGKYALQVFPEAGHFIHEDLPEKTGIAIVDFYKRNDRSALVLPPKVSDLIRQGKKV